MPTGTPKDNTLSTLNQKLEEEVTEYYEWVEAPVAEKRLMVSDPDFVEPEAPPELFVLLDYERFGTLPWDGGLFDQPDILMGQLAICRSSRDDVILTYSQIAAQQQEANNASAVKNNYR